MASYNNYKSLNLSSIKPIMERPSKISLMNKQDNKQGYDKIASNNTSRI